MKTETNKTAQHTQGLLEDRSLQAQHDQLLKALKSTADLLQVWIDGAPPYDEAKSDREVLAKARAAIDKAEGGAA